MAMILVTHDLGVVAGRTDDIAVMYAGKIVEQAPTSVLFAKMKMPYTEALVSSIPKLDEPEPHPRSRSSPAGRPTWSTRPRAATSPPAASTCRTSASRRSRRWRRPRPPATSTAAGSRSDTPEGRDALARNLAAKPGAPAARAPTASDARRHADHRPAAAPPRPRRTEMAGSGTAHLRDAERDAAAGREPGGRVPGRLTGLKVHAVTDVSIDVARGRDPRAWWASRAAASRPPAGPSCSCPPPTSGRWSTTGPGPDQAQATTTLRQLAARDADDLPGPDLVAEPAPQGGRHRGRAAAHLEARHARRAAPRSSTRPSRRSGLDPEAAVGPPAPPVLRRPVPAHLHRPVAGARPQAHHLRRAGLGPRRVGAGPDPQPARGHEGALRPHPGVHRPRPGRGEEHQRPGGGDVPRASCARWPSPTTSTPSRPTPTPPRC